jgi:glutathione-regulated potassium-efflux system ancillary protein KefG
MKYKILILFAHPAFHKSKTNLALIHAMENIEGITVRNLYEEYPDFFIDVKKEQDLLLEHDIIVWHHPFYWYSAPSIIKEWFDLVLEHNFAYGKKGNALKGKRAFNTITTGGSRIAYSRDGHNNFTITEFMRPFQQSAQLCKMYYLPPFVVHGTHMLTDELMLDYAMKYKELLISLRDDLFDFEELTSQEYLNDILESNK